MPTQKQLKWALRDHIIALNPRIMVTFTYQRQVTFDQMRFHIERFGNVVQRQVLGRRWNRFAEAERLSLIGVAEHLDTNPHVHAAISGQASLLEFLQSDEAQVQWRRIHERCGQLHVGTEHSPKTGKKHSPSAIAAYMTKDLCRVNSLDRAIFYSRGRPAPDASTKR
jgi:hypothetical protein